MRNHLAGAVQLRGHISKAGGVDQILRRNAVVGRTDALAETVVLVGPSVRGSDHAGQTVFVVVGVGRSASGEHVAVRVVGIGVATHAGVFVQVVDQVARCACTDAVARCVEDIGYRRRNQAAAGDLAVRVVVEDEASGRSGEGRLTAQRVVGVVIPADKRTGGGV